METFLEEKHAEEYQGLDDGMPDAFESWLLQLDVYEWLEFSEMYALQEKTIQLSSLEVLINKLK